MRLSVVTLIIIGLFQSIPSLGQVSVQVLGIAQDAGHPQAGCQKSCCTKAYDEPSMRHRVVSIAVSNGEEFFIIDATPDFPLQFEDARRAFPEQRFGGVFLTHAHMGHYLGLAHLGREAMSGRDVPVYCMPRMRSFLESNGPWDQMVRIHNIDLKDLHEDQGIVLGKMTVTPMLVPHRDEYSETVGFKIEGDNGSLIYIPDIDKWERWGRPLDQLVAEVDHLLLDGTFYDEHELPGRNMAEIPHPFIVESFEKMKGLSPADKKKVEFIHFNHTNPLLDDSSEAFKLTLENGYGVARRGQKFDL